MGCRSTRVEALLGRRVERSSTRAEEQALLDEHALLPTRAEARAPVEGHTQDAAPRWSFMLRASEILPSRAVMES